MLYYKSFFNRSLIYETVAHRCHLTNINLYRWSIDASYYTYTITQQIPFTVRCILPLSNLSRPNFPPSVTPCQNHKDPQPLPTGRDRKPLHHDNECNAELNYNNRALIAIYRTGLLAPLMTEGDCVMYELWKSKILHKFSMAYVMISAEDDPRSPRARALSHALAHFPSRAITQNRAV